MFLIFVVFGEYEDFRAIKISQIMVSDIILYSGNLLWIAESQIFSIITLEIVRNEVLWVWPVTTPI